MIVNQTGGGSGGEVWKHYRNTEFYEYSTSNSISKSFSVKGNILNYNVSGYIRFDDSAGRAVATGYFATGINNNKTNFSETVYTGKASSSGSSAASAGSYKVSNRVDGISVVTTSYANSYAFGHAARVVVVTDVFYQEG